MSIAHGLTLRDRIVLEFTPEFVRRAKSEDFTTLILTFGDGPEDTKTTVKGMEGN